MKSKGPLDADLARESRAGSLAAFEELVRRYEARVYRFALQLCRTPHEAAELAQDTFVRAFQAIGTFDPRQPFGPWLYTIVRRKWIDRCRRAARLAEVPHDDGQGGDAVLDPAESLAAREERQAIWHLAREVLTPLQYQALWLRYAEDLTVAEVARVLRRPQTLVKVLLFRARRLLARRLRPEACRLRAAGWPQPAFPPLPLRGSSLPHPDS